MDYLQNHIWCSSSNWGGKEYNCRHFVSISSYEDADENDWKKIITKEKSKNKDGREITAITLKPGVIKWLEDNVKDRPIPEGEKGWCIGSFDYRKNHSSKISVFFHRKNDAMAFIRQFSEHKKPVIYCQYFTDIRKELDLKTGKYKPI